MDCNFLRFLYETVPGRAMLKILSSKGISVMSGKMLDAHFSTLLISSFVKKNGIDLEEYEECKYESFNDFFCRKIKKEKRPIDMEPAHLIAPCDGLLSTYKITDGLVIPVKQSHYSIESLLQNKKLAEEFRNGTCLVYRLCVNHYHRYAYVDGGKKSRNVHINGVFHTVRPIALNNIPVFTTNSREYTLINSDKFGTLVQMEVGALLVGKIVNHQEDAIIERGAEKGYFQYGGSTIIVLIKEGRVNIPSSYYESTQNGDEVPVVLGQKIGEAKNE